jgi:ketosteroid isomerase-like protein
MSTTDELQAVLRRWTAAEADGDTGELNHLLASEFSAIGPLGFRLSKQDWLERHASGSLSYETFALDELELRPYGSAALAIARQSAAGAYDGHPVPEALRLTVLLAEDRGSWKLAAAHMSFIAGTAGAPPIPGRG